MIHQIFFNPGEADATIRASGEARTEGFAAYQRELFADARWHAGMDVLVDFTELHGESLKAEDIRKIAEQSIAFQPQYGSGRTAVVVSESLAFGLVRMYGSLVESKAPRNLRVLHTLEEARAWLAGGPIL